MTTPLITQIEDTTGARYVTLPNSTWLYVTLRDSAWLWVTLYDSAWLRMTLHDSAWLCVTPCESTTLPPHVLTWHRSERKVKPSEAHFPIIPLLVSPFQQRTKKSNWKFPCTMLFTISRLGFFTFFIYRFSGCLGSFLLKQWIYWFGCRLIFDLRHWAIHPTHLWAFVYFFGGAQMVPNDLKMPKNSIKNFFWLFWTISLKRMGMMIRLGLFFKFRH
jgi:hypothetical protein